MEKRKYKILLTVIVIVSILFKIVVVQKTPINNSTQIDARIGYPTTVEDYEKLYSNFNTREVLEDYNPGHFYYIMYIYTNHTLCDDTIGQTYHPPLHYIISAIWLTVMDFTGLDSIQKIESLQYLGIMYFIISLFIAYKILEEIEISDKAKLLFIMLFCFYPKFTYLITLITNDLLLFVFSLLSLLYLIKWLKNSNIKNAVMLALVTGIGSLVKANIVVMIIPIGIAYLIKVIKTIKEKQDFSKIYIQGMCFIFIFATLTLLYYVRCLIVLGDYKIAVPLESLYSGDATFLEKWGVNLKEIIFFNNSYSKSILSGFLYTSLVINNNVMIPIIGICNIIMMIYILSCLIKHINYHNNINLILVITFISQILSYIIYNIKYPYYCTVDTRYIPIVLFIRIIIGIEIYRSIR